jgi:hypothetical protein
MPSLLGLPAPTMTAPRGGEGFRVPSIFLSAVMDEEIAQKEGPQGGPFLFVASPGRDEIIYIPGTGMISTTSIHAPGIWKWGWSLPNIFVAASADSACTIE